MRKQKNIILLSMTLAAVLFSQLTIAQVKNESIEGIRAPSNSEQLFKNKNTLPDVPRAQWQKQAGQSVSSMQSSLNDVIALIQEARREKDVVKLNCVNQKVTSMKGFLRIAQDSVVELSTYMSTQDYVRAEDMFNKVRMSYNRMQQLKVSAMQCSGVDKSFTGTSDLAIDVDDSKTGDMNYYGNSQFFDDGSQVVTGGDGKIGGTDGNIENKEPNASVFR